MAAPRDRLVEVQGLTVTPAREEAIDKLASRVSDHSTVLQSIQVEIRHQSKTLDHLANVADKQAELAGELRRNSESIERAFQRTDSVESKLVQAIEKLAATFERDRGAAKEIADTVIGYRTAVKTLVWVSGGVWTLIAVIGIMFSRGVDKDQARTDNEVGVLRSALETRKQAVDIKFDALSQQVQEVRLDRQRDREAGEKP